jgi:hypothetical protein
MRDEQKKRVEHIKELSLRSLGEVTTAVAIIIGAPSGDDITAVIAYSKNNKDKIQSYIEGSLYFEWLTQRLKDIFTISDSINFEEIAEMDRAKYNAFNLFDKKIREIHDKIFDRTSGALQCLYEILSSHASNAKKLPSAALHLIVNVKINVENISYEIEHMNPKGIYKITRPMVIFTMFMIFLVLTPTIYFVDAYSEHASISDAFEQDRAKLIRASENSTGQ